MSVQAGIWNLEGEPLNRDFLDRISESTAEYGPDGERAYFDGTVGMLYRPFHTTLESRAERQPLVSCSGKVMTWDGRLDNRDELLLQVWNGLTETETDVAIVAAAFDRWGTSCFAKLIGDWGLSIWDPSEKELILARDYIGVKHLFYYPTHRRVVWCNHLSPLALSGDQFTLCDEYIAGYLAGQPDAHLTPYHEIRSIPPGKYVRIRGGKSSVHTYWALDPRVKTRYKTNGEYEEHYRHLFRQAVRRRLRTDSRVLSELSGGFDSSAIVCTADDIFAKERIGAQAIDTFSFHDSLEPEEDDLLYFTKVEEKRGKTGFHADLRGTGDSLVFEYPVFVARPGFGRRRECIAALSDVLQRQGYRVLLSGTNGDDVNGQTLDPRVQMADLLSQFRIVELAKQLTAWSLLIRKRPWIQLFLQTLLQFTPMSVRASLTKQGRVEPWVNPKFARKHNMPARQMEHVRGLWFARPSFRDAVQTLGTISRRMTSEAPSLVERRYPYLDQNLVEFLMTIPRDQLLRPGERRFLMRRAFADLLPAEVLNRKVKARFSRYFCVAFQKHWEKVESTFNSSLCCHLGYVVSDRIHEALLAMKNGHLSLQASGLLNALSLEFWLRDVEARGVLSIHPPVRLKADTTLVESRA